jgi:hypothetical protein
MERKQTAMQRLVRKLGDTGSLSPQPR